MRKQNNNKKITLALNISNILGCKLWLLAVGIGVEVVVVGGSCAVVAVDNSLVALLSSVLVGCDTNSVVFCVVSSLAVVGAGVVALAEFLVAARVA